MENSAPVAANRLFWTTIKANSDFVEEFVAFPFLHEYVPGEGFEEFNVLVNIINALPIEMSYVNNLKQAAFLNLISLLVKFPWSRPIVVFYRFTFADPIVNGLNFTKEWASTIWKNVICVTKCQVSAGTKDLPCLNVPNFGINPFPSGCSEYQIKPILRLRLTVFEVPVDDVNVHSDKVLTGNCSELSAKFYARDFKSALG
jgi:hypothetical protein